MNKEEISKLLETYSSSLKNIDELLKEEIKNAENGIIEIKDYEFCVYVITDYGVDSCFPKKLIYTHSPYGDSYYLTDHCDRPHKLSRVLSEDRVSLYRHIINGK